MKTKKIRFVCFTAIICCLLTAGSFGAKSYSGMNEIVDEKITRHLEDELFFDPGVPAHLIDARTANGVVTLSGSVDNILAKERSTKIAETIKGVKSVVNDIKVRPVARSDEEIRRDVEKVLLLDPATDSYEIIVRVKNGEVTLTGTVDSWTERRLAGKVAKGVKGVKELNNVIDINYKTERADRQIKPEIEKKLKWNPYVDEGLITVEVNDAKVTLRGNVGSAFEKSEAHVDSWVSGVESVNTDNLKISTIFRDDMMRKNRIFNVSDPEIKEAVKDALLFDPRVFSFDVKVKVDNGVVTLEGEVDNLKTKRAAESDAKNTIGVFSVRNRIKVRPLEVPGDKKLAENLGEAIKWDPYLERYEITPVVRNQKAYLYGVVDSYFEKERAEDVASRIFGVVDVQNNLEVNYNWTAKSDEEIKNDVQEEFFWSLLIDSTDIDIEVNDGVVTLSGSVDNLAELYAVVRNAFEGGAYRVKSKLNIINGDEIYPVKYFLFGNPWWMG